MFSVEIRKRRRGRWALVTDPLEEKAHGAAS